MRPYLYKIIILDDERTLRELLYFFITVRGDTCAQASTGAEALEILDDSLRILQTGGFDTEISDMRMRRGERPSMSGKDAGRHDEEPGFASPESAAGLMCRAEFYAEQRTQVILAYIPKPGEQPLAVTADFTTYQPAAAEGVDPALFIFYDA